jgi:adenosylhomocysteine nucleosidase
MRGNDPVRLDGASVLVSGAGPENARRAAERLLESGVGGLVSWGCAAALHPTLRPGSLLLPRRIVGSDGAAFHTDQDWRDRVGKALGDANIPFDGDDLADSRDIVATEEGKQHLALRTGAHAVDMESAAIARVALARSLPFLVIRAVADPAGMAVPSAVLRATGTDGRVDLLRLFAALVTRPGELPALIRLGLHFNAAIDTLRRAYRVVSPDLLLPAPAK